jgi:hypothetical protein
MGQDKQLHQKIDCAIELLQKLKCSVDNNTLEIEKINKKISDIEKSQTYLSDSVTILEQSNYQRF